MRISDWSSDVRSSDLLHHRHRAMVAGADGHAFMVEDRAEVVRVDVVQQERLHARSHRRGADEAQDRKSVVEGKSVSVRVDLGGRRHIKKTKNTYTICLRPLHSTILYVSYLPLQ